MSRWFQSYGFADVAPGLVVGAYPLDTQDVAALRLLRIDRVLNLTEDAEYPPGARAEVERAYAAAEIEERRVSCEDFGFLPPESIESAVEIINAWLEEGRRCYVHCRAGRQRSAAVAAGVLAVRDGLDIGEALATVRYRKPSAEPLPHQNDDLLAWWELRQRRAENEVS